MDIKWVILFAFCLLVVACKDNNGGSQPADEGIEIPTLPIELEPGITITRFHESGGKLVVDFTLDEGKYTMEEYKNQTESIKGNLITTLNDENLPYTKVKEHCQKHQENIECHFKGNKSDQEIIVTIAYNDLI